MKREPAVIIGALEAAIIAVWGVLQALGLVHGDIKEAVTAVGGMVLVMVGALFTRSKVYAPATVEGIKATKPQMVFVDRLVSPPPPEKGPDPMAAAVYRCEMVNPVDGDTDEVTLVFRPYNSPNLGVPINLAPQDGTFRCRVPKTVGIAVGDTVMMSVEAVHF